MRSVVAAVEPGDSGFVIAGEDAAVIEAGEAPRHGSTLRGDPLRSFVDAGGPPVGFTLANLGVRARS
jgi:hypothetical protein